ncbi:putative entry exclusion protein TrbK-alt [Bradyrhizobium sp. SZCCHNR3054]|uniref:putative entry exclusion protein TrbK-alt n=1 Tax=unclassified Bradyrhizobium TaxID=2631580 RepID=UPI003967563E
MKAKMFERIPTFAAIVVVVLVVAACAIRLRGDDEQTNPPASADLTLVPLPPKLAGCRSVTSEKDDALPECRKARADIRGPVLGQRAPIPSDAAAAQAGSSLFVAPKDESRPPFDEPSIQEAGKE